ncbi:hypothetical protein E2C01_048338 [Portunus trituberculatus]|uniref:Uncharacterized protein n=1 Tax=Portunus trituberculatus TaxID=210409 RepID=A0A5B7G655_PORTR|nr:hypothetical protein [Portunus trituberculatus]
MMVVARDKRRRIEKVMGSQKRKGKNMKKRKKHGWGMSQFYQCA